MLRANDLIRLVEELKILTIKKTARMTCTRYKFFMVTLTKTVNRKDIRQFGSRTTHYVSKQSRNSS